MFYYYINIVRYPFILSGKLNSIFSIFKIEEKNKILVLVAFGIQFHCKCIIYSFLFSFSICIPLTARQTETT